MIKIGRYLLLIFLAAVLTTSAFFPIQKKTYAEAANISADSFELLCGEAADSAEGSVITIEKDIAFTETITVTKKLTIRSENKSVLTVAGGFRHFSVTGGAALTLENITIKGRGGEDNSPAGGGIVTAANCGLILTDCAFINNKSSGHGGAILTAENNTATIKNCVFTNNSAKEGGAVKIEKSTAVLINSDFTQNTGTFGGAIFAWCVPGSITIDNCRFTKNESTLHSNTMGGGAIYYYGGDLANGGITAKITDSSFTENKAVRGGAVYQGYNANAEIAGIIENCLFTKNYGMVEAGAICVDSGSCSIKDTIISENRTAYGEGIGTGGITEMADGKGGGITVYSGNVILDRVLIEKNEATWGGGVYQWGLNDANATRNEPITSLKIYNSTIRGNTARSCSAMHTGGYATALTVFGTTITENYATNPDGNAVELSPQGRFDEFYSFYGCIIIGNTSTRTDGKHIDIRLDSNIQLGETRKLYSIIGSTWINRTTVTDAYYTVYNADITQVFEMFNGKVALSDDRSCIIAKDGLAHAKIIRAAIEEMNASQNVYQKLGLNFYDVSAMTIRTGNNRIYDGAMDIGAYQRQDSLTLIPFDCEQPIPDSLLWLWITLWVSGGLGLIAAAFVIIKKRKPITETQQSTNNMEITNYNVQITNEDIQPKKITAQSLPDNLTEREREIANLILKGLSRKEIAASLFVSADTVKSHIASIYKKSGCTCKEDFFAKFKQN